MGLAQSRLDMRNLLKEMTAYLLLLAFAVFMLWFFSLIARYEVAFYEPNKFILGVEIAVCVGTVMLSIERLYHFVKRVKRR